jgi:hypothetical protein
MAQPRNNPVHPFDRHIDIENWLREQWAGLFKEMVSRRSQQAQLASLGSQVTELANVNTTMKRYLEVVMSHVSEKKAAEEIIKDEDNRLAESRKLQEFTENRIVSELTQISGMSVDAVHEMFTAATGLEDLARRIASAGKEGRYPIEAKGMLSFWRDNMEIVGRLNEVRRVLGLPPLKFVEKAHSPDDTDASNTSSEDASNKGSQRTRGPRRSTRR